MIYNWLNGIKIKKIKKIKKVVDKLPNILYIIICVRQETTRTKQNKTKQNKIKYARVAQLVELLLAKEEVAGSSPVSRSQKTKRRYPVGYLRV